MGLQCRRASDSDLFWLELTSMGEMMLLPLRSLRGGADSQRGRTGEALLQALRDNIRLLTLLKPELDSEIELELLDDRRNS